MVEVDAVRCSLAFAIRFSPCRVHAAKWLHCPSVRAWTFIPLLQSSSGRFLFSPSSVSLPRSTENGSFELLRSPISPFPDRLVTRSNTWTSRRKRRGAKTAHDAESANLLNSIFHSRRPG
ncbi:hypothetical protein F441_11415 [Phytophthora nicotianae CJ01A1]|uniref:Uncharacterized protein n=1 Tax=Phytophthora nicotianae CJ01A1 TaxID=1317063 RepID=W2WTC0_PHYNI|nr:hypothetical protein F441_11415 [Phytophthora nicotianae CJ01A1]